MDFCKAVNMGMPLEGGRSGQKQTKLIFMGGEEIDSSVDTIQVSMFIPGVGYCIQKWV